MEELLGASFVNIVAMVALAIAMVTILSMCVCKTGESHDADVEENEPSPKGLKKKQKRVSVKQKTNDVVTDMDVVIDTVTSAHEGETCAEKQANGRPLSHDRALPDLPMATVRLPVDDDIEEDGHYNIVAKRPVVKQVTKATAAPTSRIYNEVGGGANAVESEENTDYAEVNDREGDAVCDPTYAGIPEARTENKSDTPGGVVLRTVRHPYVAVDISGIGNLAFTDFGDNDEADVSDSVCRSQSMTTLESTISVPAPPVPDKNFPDGQEASLVTPSSGANKSSSPLLPPRNVMDSIVGGGGLVDEDDSGEASGTVATSPTRKKKEPPYSRVTAREPLENLLRRQAEQSLLGDSFDPNYASVDYDQMKPPAFSSVASQSSDRNSLSSGFYAEIPSGDSSSLTYAKVGGVELRNHAPTPPPLATLKHLQASVEEEVPDPGYSSIRNKSRTRGAASRNSETPISATASAATCQSPLYAVVNKRRTVHSDTDLESHPSDLYAQVNKPKKNHNPDITNGARPKVTHGSLPNTTTRSDIIDAKRLFFSNPGYQTIMDPLALQAGVPSGGRLRTSSYEPPYDDIRSSQIGDLTSYSDPNYDSIKRSKSDSDAMVANPDYESVNDDGDKRNVRKGRISMVDPNYESVDLVFDDSKFKVTLVESSHEPNYEVVPLVIETEEVATVIEPPTIDLHTGGSTAAVQNGASEQWERREPIYQEINEEKRQKEVRKKKKKGKASK